MGDAPAGGTSAPSASDIAGEPAAGELTACACCAAGCGCCLAAASFAATSCCCGRTNGTSAGWQAHEGCRLAC